MIRNADFDRDTGVFTCVVANESGESRAETFFYAAAPDDEEEAKRKRVGVFWPREMKRIVLFSAITGY